MDSWKWQDLLGQLPMKNQRKRDMLGNQERIVCSQAKQELAIGVWSFRQYLLQENHIQDRDGWEDRVWVNRQAIRR